LIKWGNPLGMGSEECAAWAKGLQIPSHSNSILYSGCEYQMAAYVESLVEILKKSKFLDSTYLVFRTLAGVARRTGLNPLTAWGRVVSNKSRNHNQLIRKAALTLRTLGVDFASIYPELYSGALIYELGFVEEFKKHAEKLTARLTETGARRIITLSPHSAEILLQVYPRMIDSFDFEVKPYVAIVAEALERTNIKLELPVALSATIHDPCLQVRALKMVEEPRVVLQSVKNLNIVEASYSKEMTYCCGAPIETTFPELAELIACNRIEQLGSTGAEVVVTMCPFCYSSLKKAAALTKTKMQIVDFIEIIYAGLGEANA